MRVPVKGDSLLWGWGLLLLAAPTQATYWINQFDAYESLPKCAETPLSAIVRGMTSGCGDGNARTSYDCFCSTHSSKFNSIIATAVEKACDHSGTEVDSATSLFSSYCQLGNEGTATSTSTRQTLTTGTEPTTKRTQTVASLTTDTQSENHSTTQAATPLTSFTTSIASSTTSITSTGVATAESSSSGSDLSTGSKAAIGVCVPLVTLALFAFIFLYYRRLRRTDTRHGLVNVQLESTRGQPKHWPMTSLSETQLGSGGADYFVAGSAPMGFRPSSAQDPFASPSPSKPTLVYEKAELDATSTIAPKHELGEPPRKYELP